MIKTTKPI